MCMPPLGLVPKDVHRTRRFIDVCEAIVQYYNANWPIPIEWEEEYNELIKQGCVIGVKEGELK